MLKQIIKLPLLFFVLILSIQNPVCAQDSVATVHFVYGSDTSTPGINVNDRSNLYHNGAFDLFAASGGNSAVIMDATYRDQFKDSYGNPIKMTWWMQGGSLYRYAENTNVPFGSTMSIYLMQKYWSDAVQELKDEMTFHYHTWEWSDINGDGRYYWNQTDDFRKVQEDFDITLAEHLLEEDMFPVSFRSGWHYMDNAWQQHLNKWVPFSLHNNSPVHTNPTVEPIDNLIDWGHATTDFVPFRPSEEDYQVGGGNRGWNTRSRYFLRLNEGDLRKIFEQAQNGIPQVACVWGHLADANFIQNMEQSLQLLYDIAADYPDVPFHFSTAVEAMQDYIGAQDTTGPILTTQLNMTSEGAHIQVQSSEEIFQETPFLAVKDIYENHRVIPMQSTGSNTWTTLNPLDLNIISKWGVAVTDTLGNQSKVLMNILPDDIYIDNSDAAFSVSGNGWNTATFAKTNHIWGQDYMEATIAPFDSVKASWSATAPSDHKQQVFIRIPDIENIVSSFTLRSYIDNILVNADTLTNFKPNTWLFGGFIEPLEGQAIEVTLSAFNKDSTDLNFAVDVVKLSPLIRERQLELPLGNLVYEDKIYGNSYEELLPVRNLGNQPLTIQNIESKTGILTSDTSFPVIIPAYGSVDLPIQLWSDRAQSIQDTLIITSDDPLLPQSKKEYRVDFRNYFKVIDNEDPAGYTENGNWFTSSTQAYGSSSRYAIIQSDGNPSVRITTTIQDAGYYDLAYMVPRTVNAADRADYSIFINDELHEEYQLNQNHGSGGWVSIDMIYLTADDEAHILVEASDKNQPNKVLRADAFRFSLVGTYLDEIIVDNEGSGYTENGAWQNSVTQAYGSSSRYVFDLDATATFKAQAAASASHQVSMIVPPTENASTQAEYKIYQNSLERASVILDQNVKSGEWRSLGNWYFNEGDTVKVQVSNLETETSSRVLRADAIRLQYGVDYVTGIRDEEFSLPRSYSLSQNYPNPFNPTTTIRFTIPASQPVSLMVYDLLGKKVASLIDGAINAGTHSVVFDAQHLSSGIYYYELRAGDFRKVKPLTLIK